MGPVLAFPSLAIPHYLAQRLGSKKLSAVKGGRLSNSFPSTGLRHAKRTQSGKAGACVCVCLDVYGRNKQAHSIYVSMQICVQFFFLYSLPYHNVVVYFSIL